MIPPFALDGRQVLIENGRARRTVRFLFGDVIRVRKPTWLSAEKAFAELVRVWPKYRKRLARTPSITLIPVRFISGERLRCFGQDLRLDVSFAHEEVSARDGVLCIPQGTEDERRKAVRTWMRSEMEAWAAPLVADYAEKLGATCQQVRIRDFRSQYGSCVRRSILQFHWGIALLPDAHRRAIIAHEAAHLKHPGHGQAFWDAVEALEPGARKRHQEFRRPSQALAF